MIDRSYNLFLFAQKRVRLTVFFFFFFLLRGRGRLSNDNSFYYLQAMTVSWILLVGTPNEIVSAIDLEPRDFSPFSPSLPPRPPGIPIKNTKREGEV